MNDENIVVDNEIVEGSDTSNLEGSESPIQNSVASGSDTFVDSADTIYLNADNVVLMSDDSSLYAVGDNSGYQLPEYYVNYYRGVVDNLGDTDYLAFAQRVYTSSNTYTDHYLLIYDINVNNDIVVNGSYPCIDICRYSGQSYYTYSTYNYSLSSYPSFAYGSFGHLSSLGKGDTYETSLSILFALVVCFITFLCKSIFDYVRSARSRK